MGFGFLYAIIYSLLILNNETSEVPLGKLYLYFNISYKLSTLYIFKKIEKFEEISIFYIKKFKIIFSGTYLKFCEGRKKFQLFFKV